MPAADSREVLRQRMLAAEDVIAGELGRFEADTGIQVRSIGLVRFPSGAYKPQVHLGAAASDGFRETVSHPDGRAGSVPVTDGPATSSSGRRWGRPHPEAARRAGR